MNVLVGGLIAVIISVIALWFGGLRDMAYWVSMLGTVGVLGVVLVYVVAIDSKRRWPDTDWLIRLGRIFFFER